MTAFQGEMQKKAFIKAQFSQFNDKYFYFSDGITFLPLSHPYVEELAESKRKMGQKKDKYFWDEKENLLAIENKAQKLNERFFLCRMLF